MEKELDFNAVSAYDFFPPDEGSIELIYGRIGSGKTYCATARIIDDLKRGQVVYANWRVNFDEYDERTRKSALFWGLFGMKRLFVRIPRENFHYIDLRSPEAVRGFADWLGTRTDCTVYVDEGHTVLNSYEKTEISRKKQNSIAFTRHFNRKLIFLSQRYQNIHVQARANVNYFVKCERRFKLGRIVLFKLTTYEEMDSMSGVNEAEPSFSEWFWGRSRIFFAYDSKYQREGAPTSQKNMAELWGLTWSQIRRRFFLKGKVDVPPELGGKRIV